MLELNVSYALQVVLAAKLSLFVIVVILVTIYLQVLAKFNAQIPPMFLMEDA